jgi:hypothetical protein
MPEKEKSQYSPEDAGFLAFHIKSYGKVKHLSDKIGVAVSTLYKLSSEKYNFAPKADTLAKILAEILPRHEVPKALTRYEGYYESGALRRYLQTLDPMMPYSETGSREPSVASHLAWWGKQMGLEVYSRGEELYHLWVERMELPGGYWPDALAKNGKDFVAIYISRFFDSANGTGTVDQTFAACEEAGELGCFSSVLMLVPRGASIVMITPPKGYHIVDLAGLADALDLGSTIKEHAER